MTARERRVLDALLAVEFHGVDDLRRQADDVLVVGWCGCGCPSIDFVQGRGLGMCLRVNAAVLGSYDGLFLYTIDDPELGEVLGGIEWVGVSESDPDEFPEPSMLRVGLAPGAL